MSIADKLVTIAENEQKVFEAGKKAEYDEFWDNIQQNGNRADYQYFFSGGAWTIETFNPKYNIVPKWGGTTSMFQKMGLVGNFAEHLKQCGVELNTSGVTTSSQMFYEAKNITEAPFLDFSGITSKLTYLFYGCTALKKAHINLGTSIASYEQNFTNCTALEGLTVDGTIGQNGFDVHWSTKLSHGSITSIINALSTTTSGLTVTLSLAAVNNAFETTEGAANGSESEEWAALIETKSNWTISLA